MLTVHEIAAAVQGQLVGDVTDQRPVASVVVDSRQVTLGALFVALRGKKHDGHDFVVDAFVKGARAAIVERVPERVSASDKANAFPMVVVGDGLAALQGLAQYWRRKLALTVVAVTGSVGKTTTREVVSGVLEQRYRVLRSEGNLNTEIGVPLSIMRGSPGHQVVVLEMGMYALGEIRGLARLTQPDIGVVTNVGPTHLERLGSLENIAEAKSELVQELPAEGLAVLNVDDPRVRAMSGRTPARVAYYGLDPQADFWADDVESRGLQGMRFVLHHGAGHLHVKTLMLGIHSVHAALAASAVAHHLGMSLEDTAEALREVSPSLRLIVEAGINGSTVIDDTYNASPASTLAALNLLADLEGRKVAVLGDMRELGVFQEEGHRLVGRRAAEVADVVVAVGDLGSIIGREAIVGGKPAEAVFFAADNAEAVQKLERILKPGDCVLVKGSRGMAMEEIVGAVRCPTP